MNDEKDPLDVDAAIERLNDALKLQFRSALALARAAGSITGFAYHGLALQLWEFASAELTDTRRLVEKIVALGGTPTTDVAAIEHRDSPEATVDWILETEAEALEALQDVIPTTGHTAESEALEHLMEHVILRKQSQVDTLLRAKANA